VHGSTYDLTQKYVVDGSVSWPGTFKEKFKGKRLRVSGNGLPTDHPTGIFPIQMSDDAYQADQNGSSIISYDLSLSLPRYPERNKKATCAGGEVGVSRSGVAIYSPLDALGRDAIAFELQDACGGHPNAMGYHYHGRPACSGGTSGKKHSKVIGWAFDGFPITGPLGDKGRYMGLDDLDKCHGHSHEIKYFGQRLKLFHYHATEEFPYVVGCFRGDPAVQQVNPGAGPQGGGGPPPPP
jgi:hypothetical protein